MTTHTSRAGAGGVSARARASRWVAAGALLCGIHCMLTPVLVLALPVLALGEGFEWGALCVTATLGTILLAFGPRQRRLRHLGILGAGGALWSASLMGLFQPLPEALTSSLGSVVIAGALLLSTRPCEDGSCEFHTEPPPLS